jgi:hypothetical protein
LLISGPIGLVEVYSETMLIIIKNSIYIPSVLWWFDLDCLCSFKGRISSRYLTGMRIENQGEEFKFTSNVGDSKVLFSILYHDSDWLSLNSSTATILSCMQHYLLSLCILETRGFLFLFLFLLYIYYFYFYIKKWSQTIRFQLIWAKSLIPPNGQ